MIKMIATDIDGTIVKDSSPSIYAEFPELVKKLVQAGYHFTVASGRAYPSICNIFRGVTDQIYCIAENGAHVLDREGNALLTIKMKREHVVGIMQDVRTLYPQGCDVVISTPECTYLESSREEFVRFMEENYHNAIRLTEDILAEPVEVLKIAIHKSGSIRELGEGYLIPKWENTVKACMAGEEWVDFMDGAVDKGNALRFLQEHFGCTAQETIAFGDNANDIGMLQAAGISYAVENARDEIKAAAKYVCPGYQEKGVFHRLNKVLEEGV